ncbi:hypothetical protein RYA05_04400 [Pseudomonas syringae pv. actinidiae]|nr:hypothetical protein [Pseudomonas syringae pv. actinidiae]
MGDTVQVDKQELQSLLVDVLAGGPGHLTHPMSIWNKAKRMWDFLESGERVSEAKSWDEKSETWVL